MKYNLEKENEVIIFKKQAQWLIDNKKQCELNKLSKTRSLTENRCLHLWFKHISDELNELGETFHYFGISGKEFEMPFTETIIKEFVIKPIIMAMFNIESTTKLTNDNINKLIDVINKFMSNKGLYLPWPSIQSMLDYYENK